MIREKDSSVRWNGQVQCCFPLSAKHIGGTMEVWNSLSFRNPTSWHGISLARCSVPNHMFVMSRSPKKDVSFLEIIQRFRGGCFVLISPCFELLTFIPFVGVVHELSQCIVWSNVTTSRTNSTYGFLKTCFHAFSALPEGNHSTMSRGSQR